LFKTWEKIPVGALGRRGGEWRLGIRVLESTRKVALLWGKVLAENSTAS